jgi:hypothetical protein
MANNDIVIDFGTVRSDLPSVSAEGTYAPIRVSRHGEMFSRALTGSKLTNLAGEGSYFVATNATLGTALSGTAAPTAFSATVALLALFNSAATTGKSIHVDYLRLYPKAAGTNGTNFSYAMSVDRTNRYSSGGTAITPVNANINSDVVSAATIYAGAITAAAAGASVRRFSHGQLRSVIKVIGDVYEFRFGDSSAASQGMPLEGTLQANIVTRCAPLVIPPGCSWLFHELAASQSVAATFELELGYWER